MSVRKILTEPNKLLREISKPVEKVGEEERKLMDDMLETMYAAPGIGLAAIQIGVPKRIIVMDISNDKDKKPLTETEKQISELLETRVNPVVASHGGEISFHSFKEGVVYLELKGSCAGCPSSTATLKMGIENMLKHYHEEIKEVVEVSYRSR